jgi:predicted DNA-binding transcriptional regulator AlpA
METITTTLTETPLLVSAEQAAMLLGVSRATFWSLNAAGSIPLPVKLKGCKRTLWRREELIEFVRAGCPAREKWQEIFCEIKDKS